MEKPTITLYCLPFAGGNSYSYRDFQAHVDDAIKIVPIELPGRMKRIREPLLTNLETMADDVFAQVVKTDLTQPYAIYGHSMGAMLGYLLTKRLLQTDTSPRHLFFSGCNAPPFVGKEAKSYLSKDDFITMLKELGGAPQEILDEPQLIDFFEPVLRTDFRALENYVYQPMPAAFDLPMTVLFATEDNETDETSVSAWQQETRQRIEFQKFDGGHFFIFDYLPQIGQLFTQTLASS